MNVLMRKKATNSLILSLVGLGLLSSCQAPGQVSAGAPLSREAYSKQFLSLYRDYAKASVQGNDLGLLASGGLNSTSGAPANSSNSLSPQSIISPLSFSAVSAPSSSSIPSMAPPAGPSGSDQIFQQLELFKKMMDSSQKAMAQLTLKLKATTPPAELAEKHATLLEYMDLSQQLLGDLLAELNAKGAEGLRELSSDAFRAQLKTKYPRYLELAPKVRNILYEFELPAYHQERLSLEQGPELDAETYKTNLRSLLAKLPNLMGGSNGMAPLMGILVGGMDPAHSKDTVSKFKTDSQQALDQLGHLHPPAAYAEAQTVIYATAKLNREIFIGIFDRLSTALAEPGKNPLSFLSGMFTDEATVSLMMDLGIFMPKYIELTPELTGVKLPPIPEL